MKTIAQILLALMPLFAVPGWDCREGWELITIWGAAIAVSLLLSSWWRRAFLWICLFQIVAHKIAVSYASFAMIAIGLLSVEAFKRVDPDRIVRCMMIGAGSLGALMMAQLAGLIPIYSPYGHAGWIFNPSSAGVYLALCLPAFVHVWWAAGACLALIAVSHSTTAMLTGAVVVGFALALREGHKRHTGRRVPVRKGFVGALAVAVLLLVLIRLDPIGRTLREDLRWELWRQTLQTYDSAPFGRGIGSYQQIMPYWVANNSRLVNTKTIGQVDGKPVLSQDIWWNYAHNEFLQAGFELGPAVLVLVGVWGSWVMLTLVRRRRDLSQAGIRAGIGIAALAVSCLGWFTFHVAPLAIVGMAWIGTWERENRALEGRSGKGAGVWS